MVWDGDLVEVPERTFWALEIVKMIHLIEQYSGSVL